MDRPQTSNRAAEPEGASPRDWTIAPSALATMQQAAREAFPLEACGLLLGAGCRIEQAVPVANRSAEPADSFEIDPEALIAAHRSARAGGPQLLGYFHSHPNGLPRPSHRDEAAATGDRRVWAIIALARADQGPEINFWRDELPFSPLPFAVTGRRHRPPSR